LDKLTQNPGADVPAGSTGGSSTASASSPTSSTPPDASAITNPFETLQKGALPGHQELQSSSAKLTSVEKLRDELAYRNAVQAALRETELDDAHDLNGYTLRTLKFDISVTPLDERAEDIGMIRLTANPEVDLFEDPNEIEAVYRAWQQSVLQQARLEALSLQRRYVQGLITDDDIVQSPATRARVGQYLLLQTEEPRNVQDDVGGVEDSNRQQRRECLGKAITGLNALQFNEPNRQLDPNTSMALCKIVEWRYRTLHGKYLYFNDIPTPVRVDGKTLYLPDLWPSPESIDQAEHSSPQKVPKILAYRKGLLASLTKRGTKCCREEDLNCLKTEADREEERLSSPKQPDRQAILSYEIHKDTERVLDFIKAIQNLDGKFRPYVYTVEPKELAQNISDVAAAEKLSSLVLAASAALPKSGLNVGGYLDALDRSQLRLQAILRRPLVVGFVGSEDQQEQKNVSSFGWALGPRFEIGPRGEAFRNTPHSGVRYRQAEAQHSVQATMAVPGWLDKIVFRYRVGWRDPSAQWPHPRETPWGPNKCLSIDLPRDYDAITSALLDRHESYDQVPTVLPAKSGDPRVAPYLLTEGEEKAAILIRGANLWRNPQVFIGGQKAETVLVLPDMGGLNVIFDKVRLPTTVDHGSARVDLTIVTSQGVARLPQAVQILPKVAVKPTGTVELKTAYAVPKGKLEFTVSNGLIPNTSYFSTHLRARDTTRMTWFDVIAVSIPGEPNDTGPRKLTFELDSGHKFTDHPARLTFDLAIQDKYGTAYYSIPSFAAVKGELVYFPDASQAKLKPPAKPWRIKRETKSPPLGPAVTTYVADADLVFQTDPNVSLDLFERARPWIAEEKTAFSIEFTQVGGGTSISVPLSPGALQLSGDKRGEISIRKSDLIGRDTGDGGSKERMLFDLYDSLGRPSNDPKPFKIKIKHSNGKDSVEVDGELKIFTGPASQWMVSVSCPWDAGVADHERAVLGAASSAAEATQAVSGSSGRFGVWG
jgi:hypothetical protein